MMRPGFCSARDVRTVGSCLVPSLVALIVFGFVFERPIVLLASASVVVLLGLVMAGWLVAQGRCPSPTELDREAPPVPPRLQPPPPAPNNNDLHEEQQPPLVVHFEDCIVGYVDVANVMCAICHEEEGTMAVLPCSHKYHRACIEEWFRRKIRCPVCMADPVSFALIREITVD